MEQRSGFPPSGFLVLGVLSLAAVAVFLARIVTVEATAERVWSAALFGLIGIFDLWAYRAARHWRSRSRPTGFR